MSEIRKVIHFTSYLCMKKQTYIQKTDMMLLFRKLTYTALGSRVKGETRRK